MTNSNRQHALGEFRIGRQELLGHPVAESRPVPPLRNRVLPSSSVGEANLSSNYQDTYSRF